MKDDRQQQHKAATPQGAHYAPEKRLVDKIFAGDKVLWVVIVLLLIFSLFVVYSTTAYDSSLNANQELIKQLLYICISLTAFFFTRSLHPDNYRPLLKIIYWGAILLTLIMLISYGGSNAARSLSVAGFDFQPFELLKIAVVLVVADQLAKRQKVLHKIDIIPPFTRKAWSDKETLLTTLRNHTLPVLGPIVLACCLTLRTSNSTTVIIALSCLAMLIIGRVKWADIGRIVLIGVVVGGMAFMALGMRKDTAKGRLGGYSPNMFAKTAVVQSDGKEYYLSPEHELDQTTYAKMSIASGHIRGKGPGQSTNRLLQEADKDMAYAFLMEEYGLLGGLIILLCYLIMFYRTMEIFRKCGTAFPGLAVLGVGTTIVLQAFLHMCVSVSLLPITGQQLPIVSKGGSSLVFVMAAIGLVMGISAYANDGTLNRSQQRQQNRINKK